jgi:hypothetical protein
MWGVSQPLLTPAARTRSCIAAQPGKDDQASQPASSELPGKVDTDKAQHAEMLSKYGIDPRNIGDKR